MSEPRVVKLWGELVELCDQAAPTDRIAAKARALRKLLQHIEGVSLGGRAHDAAAPLLELVRAVDAGGDDAAIAKLAHDATAMLEERQRENRHRFTRAAKGVPE